jgi:tryprostatin B 6-hydroxylase
LKRWDGWYANVDAVAYMEMRTLTTQLLLAYDVALASGEDGHKLLYETRDHFTLGLGELNLVFTPVST